VKKLLAIILGVLCLSYLSYSADKSLVSYWSFDEGKGEVVKDTIGKNDAEVKGDVEWIDGVKGKAMQFAGKEGFCEVPDAPDFSLGEQDQSYSVSFWYKCNKDKNGTSDSHFICKFGTAYPYNFVQNGAGSVEFRVYDGEICTKAITGAPLNDGKWHFIVGVKDAKGKTVDIWVDGVMNASSQDATIQSSQSDANLQIGNGSPGLDFLGAIDELKIYKKVLSDPEIAAEYKANGGKIDNKTATPKKTVVIQKSKIYAEKDAVPYARKQLLGWKTVLNENGKVSCSENVSVFNLSNSRMSVSISKKTGEITSVTINGSSILSRPASVEISDKVEKITLEERDARITSALLENNSPKSATITIKKSYGTNYSTISKFTMDADSLLWDVQLFTELSPVREANIDFVFPALSTNEKAFWCAEKSPAKLTKMPVSTIIYRQVDAPGGVVVPTTCLYNATKDFGFSLISPIGLPKPGLSFRFIEDYLKVSNYYLHLNKGESTRAAVYIVPHEGDWRPGLAWMLERYPKCFTVVSKTVVDGEGWFAIGGPFVSESDKKRAAKRLATWEELHGHFPFYGLYFPDKERWYLIDNCATKPEFEQWEAGDVLPKAINSYENIRNQIDSWHKYNIQSYVYFQSFEGLADYAEKYYPSDITRDMGNNPHSAWYFCRLMNPDPLSDWGKHIASQVDKFLEAYPKADGIFYDRDDYWNYDYSHDDGVTTIRNRNCYMLGFAQEQINKIMLDKLHAKNKGVWTNGPTSLEVCADIDGIMAEMAPQVKWLQYAGLQRPMIELPWYFDVNSYDKTPAQTEEKLKLALTCGYMPALCTAGGLRNQRIEDKFKQLFEFTKGRKWVLNAHALEVPEELAANIYKLPNGNYYVGIADMNRTQLKPTSFLYNIPVKVRVPDTKDIKYCYLLSGDYRGVSKIDFIYNKDGSIDVKLPFFMANAMIILAKAPIFEIMSNQLPVFTKGELNKVVLNVENITSQKKNYSIAITTEWNEKNETFTLAPSETKQITSLFIVPSEVDNIEYKFTVNVNGKEEVMSAWVQDEVQVSFPSGTSVVLSSQGSDIAMNLVNTTSKSIELNFSSAVIKGKAKIKAPDKIIIKPFEAKNVPINISDASLEGAASIVVKKDKQVIYETVLDIRGVMGFAKDDLFHDDFKSNDMSKWTVDRGNWVVENGEAEGSQSAFAITGDSSWGDYVVEAKTKCKGSENTSIGWLKAYIYLRVQDISNFYRFGIHGDAGRVELYKNDNNDWKELGVFTFTAEKDKWYTFRVEAKGNVFKAFLDGKQIIDAKDSVFSNGGIAIGVTDDLMITSYKDVIVKKIQ